MPSAGYQGEVDSSPRVEVCMDVSLCMNVLIAFW